MKAIVLVPSIAACRTRHLPCAATCPSHRPLARSSSAACHHRQTRVTISPLYVLIIITSSSQPPVLTSLKSLHLHLSQTSTIMSTTMTTGIESRPTGMTTTTTACTTNTGEGGTTKETMKVVETVDYRSSAGQGQEERKPVAVVHEYLTGGKDDPAAASAAPLKPRLDEDQLE